MVSLLRQYEKIKKRISSNSKCAHLGYADHDCSWSGRVCRRGVVGEGCRHTQQEIKNKGNLKERETVISHQVTVGIGEGVVMVG